MHKIKIMIVDDHVVVREGLKQLLSLGEDMEVVAEAGSGLDCLELLNKTLEVTREREFAPPSAIRLKNQKQEARGAEPRVTQQP